MKEFFKIFIEKLKTSNIVDTGAVLAYNTLFSFFPLVIVILNVVSFIFKGSESQVLRILTIFPEAVERILRPVILELINQSSGSLLSISLVVALWSSSKVMRKVMKQISEAFDYEGKSFILTQVLGLALALAMVVSFVLLLATGPLSKLIKSLIEDSLGSALNLGFLADLFIDIGPYLVLFLVLTLTYRISVLGADIDLKDVLPASIFTSLVLFVLTYLFSFYISNFASYSKTYGSLGGIIVLLLWLYLAGIVITLGAYFASSLMDYKRLKDDKELKSL